MRRSDLAGLADLRLMIRRRHGRQVPRQQLRRLDAKGSGCFHLHSRPPRFRCKSQACGLLSFFRSGSRGQDTNAWGAVSYLANASAPV